MMNSIEIMRNFASELDNLAYAIRSSRREKDDRTAKIHASSYERWSSALLTVISLLGEELKENAASYMGIGIENWTGLTDIDGDNINFDDVMVQPAPDDGDLKLYYQIKFIQDDGYSKIAKVSGSNHTDIGHETAAKLKRVGPGKDHPEILREIHGDKP